MIDSPRSAVSSLARDRLLLVADRSGSRDLLDQLHARYPDWGIATTASPLSAIADLTRHPARVVLACIDSTMRHLGDAVAGLREAAGDRTRLVLCCRPESEAQTRRVMGSGADDYLLLPLDGDELDAAIGVERFGKAEAAPFAAAPAASMEELAMLGDVLAGMDLAPRTLLERAATLVRLALRAEGAMVVVQGAAATAGETVARPVLTAPLKDGPSVMGQVSVAQRPGGGYTPGDVDKLTHYAAVIGHVIAAASRQRQWQRLAVTDECSGLPNRRYLYEQLDAILAQATAEQFPVTVLLFDVDDFKSYNDQYGHGVGDQVLRLTGELFRRHCREQDVIARFGGDEFAVVFWDPEGPRVAGSKHPGCALTVLDRVNEALRTQTIEGLGSAGEGRLTISGGLATYPWDATQRDELIKRADEALLAAKRAGKNRIYLIGEAGDSAPHSI